MLIAQYFVEFIFYSFLGWLWESFYCTLKEHRWQDRGFLFGPICPIYGASVVAASILFRFVPVISSPDLPTWQMFLICMAGSAIAEFSTSWVLEKRFHARWWDYSKMPLNIQGRICLPVSLAFGAAGVVIVKYLLPVMMQAHTVFPALGYEGLSLGFAILFGADFALTEASMSALLSEIEAFHEEFNEKAESTYEHIAQAPRHLEENLEERLQKLIAECGELNNRNSLPVRIGIYLHRMEPVEPSSACDRAKYACDQNRDQYASGYYYFDKTMLEQANTRQYITSNLDRALKEKWIKVYYQPIIRAANGRVCDEEALARFVLSEKAQTLAEADHDTRLQIFSEIQKKTNLEYLFLLRADGTVALSSQGDYSGIDPIKYGLLSKDNLATILRGTGRIAGQVIPVVEDNRYGKFYFYSVPCRYEAEQYTLVLGASASILDLQIETLRDATSVLDSVIIENNGFLFSVDPINETFLYYDDGVSNLSGTPIAEAGLSAENLRDIPT